VKIKKQVKVKVKVKKPVSSMPACGRQGLGQWSFNLAFSLNPNRSPNPNLRLSTESVSDV